MDTVSLGAAGIECERSQLMLKDGLSLKDINEDSPFLF